MSLIVILKHSECYAIAHNRAYPLIIIYCLAGSLNAEEIPSPANVAFYRYISILDKNCDESFSRRRKKYDSKFSFHLSFIWKF